MTKIKKTLFLMQIKQTEVAKKAGVGTSYVNKVVNGLDKKPSPKLRKALCELTGLTEKQLFERNPYEN